MLIICPIASVGSFLQPLIISKPKAMIKIAGKRIIDHIFALLRRNFPKGTKICFIIGYKKRIIKDYILEHYNNYFSLIFEEQEPIGYTNDVPYFAGIGAAISLAEKHGRNDDCFIFFSDHYPTENFTPMLKKLEKKDFDGVVNVREVEEPQYYGVCVVDTQSKDHLIKKAIEKPNEYVSNLAITWGYVFSKRICPIIFDYLNALKKAKGFDSELNKPFDFTQVIQMLIDEGYKIGANIMKSPILDFGRIKDFLAGNLYLLNHQSSNENTIGGHDSALIKTDEIFESKIIPPVYIGKNCVIKKSIVGPNVSVGDNTQLTQCIITNSVVGDYSNLKNIITEKSIIGDYVSIEDFIKKSISIGDSSSLNKSKLI